MKKISYKIYVMRVEKRLDNYPKDLYEWKYEFIKDVSFEFKLGMKLGINVFNLFDRYMHDDTRINWDMEDAEN